MEVSDQEYMQGGQKLIDSVVSLTGIPAPLMQRELSGILETSGHSSAELTIEELRAALVEYLETMKDELFQEGSDFVSGN